MSNIVIAKFTNTTSIVTEEIWQWNYGQILRIQGLNLPRAVEVHFSIGNLSKTRIGTTIDGVTDVAIPDSILEVSGRAKAYVYLHVGDDDGETEYEITIPVKARAEPEEYDAEEDVNALREAIALLQDDLVQTGADREAAEGAKNDAEAAKRDAESARDTASQHKTDAEAAKRDAEAALASIAQKERDITAAGQAAEGRIASANAAAASLERTIGAIGLYIDADGDICQGEEES